MQNKEFMAEMTRLLKPYLGLYTRKTDQQYAIAFHQKSRDVLSVSGLECIVMPKVRTREYNGSMFVYVDFHAVVFLQNPGGDGGEFIYEAMERVQRYAEKMGAIKTKALWEDIDFTQEFTKQAQIGLWLTSCECDYDVCDDFEGL